MNKNNKPIILINALASSVGGNKRFYFEFIKYACREKNFKFIFLKDKNDQFGLQKNKYIKYISPKIYNKNTYLPGGIFRALKRMLWERRNLSHLIKKYNVSLYFTRAHQIPRLPYNVKAFCAISSVLPLLGFQCEGTLFEKVRNLIQKQFLFQALKRCSLCICISAICKNKIIKSNLISKQTKVVLIRNGLNCDQKIVKVREKNQLNILSVGNFYKYKQYNFLLKIIYNLTKEKAIKLTIVGNPYDFYYFKSIEKQINKLQLNNKVQILQRLTPAQIKKQYLTNDLFISTSLYENSPIALLDALQFGLPCLTSRIPAHMEILGSRAQNMLFSPVSANEAVIKISRLIEYKNRLKNQGIVLKRRILFSWEKTFNHLFAEFKRTHAGSFRHQ
jgi:glycosyltransferase involved in cell wall biosynthesis